MIKLSLLWPMLKLYAVILIEQKKQKRVRYFYNDYTWHITPKGVLILTKGLAAKCFNTTSLCYKWCRVTYAPATRWISGLLPSIVYCWKLSWSPLLSRLWVGQRPRSLYCLSQLWLTNYTPTSLLTHELTEDNGGVNLNRKAKQQWWWSIFLS